MGGEREQIDTEPVDVQVEEAGRLHGVGVDQGTAFPRQSRDLGDRLNGPDLVVGEHDADEKRIGADGGRHGCRLDDPAAIDRHIGDLDSEVRTEIAGGAEHGAVLDGRGDQVPLTRPGQGRTLEGQVVALGAAAGEHHLVRVAAEHAGHLGAGPGARVGGPSAERVEVRRIAEFAAQIGFHGLEHPRMHGGRRRVVEIDRAIWCRHAGASISRLKSRAFAE